MAWQKTRYPLQRPSPGSEESHPGQQKGFSNEPVEKMQRIDGSTTDDVNVLNKEHPLAPPTHNKDDSPQGLTGALNNESAEAASPRSSVSLPTDDDGQSLSTRRFTQRSLRRTPGSGSLKQIASDQSLVASAQESLTAHDITKLDSLKALDEQESGPMPLASMFERQAYPTQQVVDDSTAHHQDLEPSNEYNNGEAPKGKVAFSRQSYPMQPSSAGSTTPTSPTFSGHPSEEMNHPSLQPIQYTSQIPKSSHLRRRRGYPLQTPASNANLRRSSSPPLSSSGESEQTHATSATLNSRPVAQAKSQRRKGYPLQAPASMANLQQPPTPPSSPDEAVGSSDTPPPESARGLSQDIRSLRRQAYPLQSQASVSALRDPPHPDAHGEPTTDVANVRCTETVSLSQGSIRSSKSLRRQVYPLQSQASVAVLRDLAVPQSSAMATEENARPQPQPDDSDQGSVSFRRKGYPLQAQASASVIRGAPEPELSASGPNHDTNNSQAKSTREHELATKVVDQWRGVMRDNAEAVHLPRNVRALKDSSKPVTGRTIIVCLDGTGDKFDNDNSNIVHIISALKKSDPRQVTYYQAGIGTYGEGGLSGGISAAMDMAVGAGLGLHVRDAYHFLMHAYKEDDKICIFGFSRGAYTARCLAGMIHKVGLLPPRNIQQIPFAYEFYANESAEGWKQSADFKSTFCINVNVYFLGCFDSVASVGFIPRTLPLSSTPSNKPQYFRHAMALDERRAKFKICRHQNTDWDDVTKSDGRDNHPNLTDEEYKRLTANGAPFKTNSLEVWFAGAHADIGGGAVRNSERHKLAQIPLRWMIRQAFECNTGIIFKTRILAEFGLDVHTLWPVYERLSPPSAGPPQQYTQKYDKALPPRSIRRQKLVVTDRHENGEQLYRLQSHTDEDWTPELVEDYFDAMSTLNDQLIQAPSWWILEFWPVEYKIPNAPGDFTVRVGPNLGRYRTVEDVKPKVHWTVLRRGENMGYKIRARAPVGIEWQTVV